MGVAVSQERILSVGVIGAGSMGARHAGIVREQASGAQVTGVYDLDGERARSLAELSAGRVFDDPLRLIADPEIDAVVIASPDDTHRDFALACIADGKPVLCEKPLTEMAEDARKVLEAEVRAGKRLISVALMRRFDPYHMAVYDLVRSGSLGRPVLSKGIHRHPSSPEDTRGETLLTNSASHDFDAARWLLGQEVEKSYVQGVRTRDSFTPETRDLVLLQLGFTGDCLATIEISGAVDYGYEVTAEVVGQKGVATSRRPDLATVRSSGTVGADVPQDWLDRFQEAYVAQMREWVAAVRSGARFKGANAWDGYMTLHLTDACIRTFQSGAPVTVDVPARPALYDDND